MNFLKSVFFVLIIVVFTNFDEITCDTVSENATHPDYPGKCFYNNNVYDPGEIQIKNRCIRLVCSQKGWVSGHSCQEQMTLQAIGCERGAYVDIRKPFPDCCKRKYRCKQEDGTEYVVEDF